MKEGKISSRKEGRRDRPEVPHPGSGDVHRCCREGRIIAWVVSVGLDLCHVNHLCAVHMPLTLQRDCKEGEQKEINGEASRHCFERTITSSSTSREWWDTVGICARILLALLAEHYILRGCSEGEIVFIEYFGRLRRLN